MSLKVIQHVELGSDTTSITLSNIPQTFNDLLLKFSVRVFAVGQDSESIGLGINGLGFQRWRFGGGNGVSPTSGNENFDSDWIFAARPSTANIFASGEAYILGYTNTTRPKTPLITSVAEVNGASAFAIFSTGFRDSNAAVTSLRLGQSGTSNPLRTFSSVTLYGISNTI